MKRIIVPVDFSAYAENAFLSALKIAEKGDTSITCVNVVATDLEWDKLSENEKSKHLDIMDLESEANEKLHTFVQKHEVKYTSVEAAVEVGVPWEEVVVLAKKQAADLVVIGAHGKGHEEGKFIGSNIQKVMRHAPCPVLAVKKPLNGLDFRKMAFASVFDEESKPAFVRILPWIRQLGSSVHFLYINVPEKSVSNEKMEAWMKQFSAGLEDLTIHTHVADYLEVEKGIIAFCESQKMGWIGIASHNRKAADSYHIGVTDTVLFKTDIPILSVRLTE